MTHPLDTNESYQQVPDKVARDPEPFEATFLPKPDRDICESDAEFDQYTEFYNRWKTGNGAHA